MASKSAGGEDGHQGVAPGAQRCPRRARMPPRRLSAPRGPTGAPTGEASRHRRRSVPFGPSRGAPWRPAPRRRSDGHTRARAPAPGPPAPRAGPRAPARRPRSARPRRGHPPGPGRRARGSRPRSAGHGGRHGGSGRARGRTTGRPVEANSKPTLELSKTSRSARRQTSAKSGTTSMPARRYQGARSAIARGCPWPMTVYRAARRTIAWRKRGQAQRSSGIAPSQWKATATTGPGPGSRAGSVSSFGQPTTSTRASG